MPYTANELLLLRIIYSPGIYSPTWIPCKFVPRRSAMEVSSAETITFRFIWIDNTEYSIACVVCSTQFIHCVPYDCHAWCTPRTNIPPKQLSTWTFSSIFSRYSPIVCMVGLQLSVCYACRIAYIDSEYIPNYNIKEPHENTEPPMLN